MIRSLVLVFLLGLLQSAALAQTSWPDAIERMKRMSEFYEQYARERGETWAGAMYSGHWRYTSHSCAIIGRMIGQKEAIAHLEELEYPDHTLVDEGYYAHAALVFSISLANWVGAAESALAMSESERINTWNLECAATDLCPSCRMVESQHPQADIVRDGSSLRVFGDIEAGFAERFEAALDANPDVVEIRLGSNGGSVADAVRAGLMIRERGLETVLDGNCNSACPLVFLGGRVRTVWATGARFGLHQISRDGAAVAADDRSYGIVAQYVSAMGGNPRAVIKWMLSAPPEAMARPEPREYCDLGLATWVQRVCPH